MVAIHVGTITLRAWGENDHHVQNQIPEKALHQSAAEH